ncbi:MAG: TolC family protein [Aquificae bacterium]|nr:TolC family protein [Aquificota bacterium]
MLLLILLMVSLSFGMSLREAMETALRENPEIKALEEELKVFDGMERSASAFPNPEVRIESGFITNDKDGNPKGKAFNLLEFDQPLPLWGVRSIGKEVVSEERRAFENLSEAKKREILAQVYRAFYRSLALKEKLRIREEEVKVAREVESFVEKAYNLGEVTKLELFRARRERGSSEVRLRIAQSQYEASLKELSALIGRQVSSVEGSFQVPAFEKPNPSNLPQIKALERKIKAVEKRIQLEKALSKPTLKAGFVVEDSEEGYYGLRGSLSFDIPAFYRRQGEILQHIHTKNALKNRLSAQKLKLKGRLESVEIRFNTLKEELRRLEEEIIPQAREELKLALRSYRLRAITLLELSDVRRRYYQLLEEKNDLLLKLHEVYSELIEIGGWK